MIGLFGGTFDPIHFGHLRPALDVYQALGLRELRFIPAALPPHRARPGLSARRRAEMVRLAIARQPGFVLDTCELERAGPSYTVDTLTALRARYGPDRPLVLLVGSDAFAQLPTWHRWRELLALAHVAVMARPGAPLDERAFPAGYVAARRVDSATPLQRTPAGHITVVPVTQFDLSATRIRRLLAAGASIRYLTPEAVVAYIDRHRLYRTRSNT